MERMSNDVVKDYINKEKSRGRRFFGKTTKKRFSFIEYRRFECSVELDIPVESNEGDLDDIFITIDSNLNGSDYKEDTDYYEVNGSIQDVE